MAKGLSDKVYLSIVVKKVRTKSLICAGQTLQGEGEVKAKVLGQMCACYIRTAKEFGQNTKNKKIVEDAIRV